MRVEVWTDIMCPYCYIGKIHYEQAMKQFAHADEVELVIKAFQLNPDLPGNGNGIPVTEYLTRMAGYDGPAIQKMFSDIGQLAESAGVKFNLPNAFAANTLDAHRLVKLAARSNLASNVLSLISKAYFEDAQDYSDIKVLTEIGVRAGLDAAEIARLFTGDDFIAEVGQDIREAHQLGIDTIPTFLFERKQAIIGSEPAPVFLDTLHQASVSRTKADAGPGNMEVKKGKSCHPDGTCEI